MVYIKLDSKLKSLFQQELSSIQGTYGQFKSEEAEKFAKSYIDYLYIQQWSKENKYSEEDLHKIEELLDFNEILFTRQYQEALENLDIVKKLFQEPEIKQMREQLLQKQEERKYNLLFKNSSKIFSQVSQKQMNIQGEVKDMEKSMSFGISFIFTLFLSAISGYLIGSEILNLPKIKSYILAAFFLITTLIMETILFIIKTNKKPLKNSQNANNIYNSIQKHKKE